MRFEIDRNIMWTHVSSNFYTFTVMERSIYLRFRAVGSGSVFEMNFYMTFATTNNISNCRQRLVELLLLHWKNAVYA